jgi:choline dehydrogenase-like flavoprotein
MPQSNASPQEYDAVIVGAGAGGGTAVRVLTDHGMKVCLLEAGPMLDPTTEFKEHKSFSDYDHRGVEDGGKFYFGGGKPFGFMTTTSGGWTLPGEPYTVGEGSQFKWFRSRIVGGRTNHYGRMSFRFSEFDFKARDRDGLGHNWPIDYSDISPYYDKAERFIGVTGSVEGIPSAPDGIFEKPPAPQVHTLLAREAGKKLGIPFIANRRAVITSNKNGRAACHYCGECGRGCLTASAYSASQVEIFPALESGNATLITGAMVREISVDSNGKPNGVIYIDRDTRREVKISAKAVILAASSCESARILLNSKSRYHPNGIGNSSGQVGRNLMDTVGFGLQGYVPYLEGMPHYDSNGFGGTHLYAPWWAWDDHEKLGFPRGYHIEFGGGFRLPGPGSYHGAAQRLGYGAKMKKQIREQYGASVSFAGRGEMIANDLSYCELDPNVVDQWGIPVLKFHFKWADLEWKQARHMERSFTEIIEAMGGRVLGLANAERESDGISVPGSIIHEVGTARMGERAETSVLNSFNQAWDAKNLFVVDGASFVSNPDKNPTLTINALSWRACDYLADEMRKGNV